MISLSNDVLRVDIDLKGAELQSIFNKQHSLEYLWSGDAAFWGKKSPVLFPIVGGLKDNSYLYNGHRYTLGRHGFARDRHFHVTSQTAKAATFTLASDEQTYAQYPFHFRFSVEYAVEDNRLSVTYVVENTGNKDLLFSVGGHPAFRVLLVEGTAYEDYFLRFNAVENAGRFPLSKDGLIEMTALPLLENSDVLPLKKDLFREDAIVFKDLKSDSISLLSQATAHGLKVHFSGFLYMGIWAAPGADFVCIEPWCGIADSVNATGELENKEGIVRLPAGTHFRKGFTVELF